MLTSNVLLTYHNWLVLTDCKVISTPIRYIDICLISLPSFLLPGQFGYSFSWKWHMCSLDSEGACHSDMSLLICMYIVNFTDEQYTTINQSTAGRFNPRVFVNCLHTRKQLTKTLGSKHPAID